MEKLILSALIISTLSLANRLESKCLNCHIDNGLPTKLIYKRYLMKYSTDRRMKKAILNYLKSPDPKESIMPKEFFLKFTPKKPIKMEQKELEELIELFLDRYNVKHYLR
jgi:hypothetical protein